jgi:hypothetical protein
MNLKQICNEVLSQSAFLERDAFATSQDVDDIQMVAFVNRAAHEIREYYPWNRLRKSTSITLVDGQLSYDLPSDFDWYVTESMWKSMGARHVVIPTSDRYWAFIKAGNPGTRINYYAKLIDGKLEFTAVTAGDVINLDYISRFAVKNAAGGTQEYFTADTDEWLLKDYTLILGTKAFWKGEKEMPTAERDKMDFQNQVKTDVAQDTPAKVIRTRGYEQAGFPYAPPISADYLW